MNVSFGIRELEFPTDSFGYLRESNDALTDVGELKRRLADDGYLFIRSLINRDAVLTARHRILDYMAKKTPWFLTRLFSTA